MKIFASNFTEIDYRGHYRKKCKTRSKGIVKGSRDLLLHFWDSFISLERLKQETSNLARILFTTGANDENAKLGQRASGMGHVKYF